MKVKLLDTRNGKTVTCTGRWYATHRRVFSDLFIEVKESWHKKPMWVNGQYLVEINTCHD